MTLPPFRMRPLALAVLFNLGACASALAQTPEAAVLAPVRVEGNVDQSPASGDAYAAVRSRSSTKTDSALIDIPQTVNIVTRNEMDRQGSTSVSQALRFTPGVVTQYGDNDARHDWLTVRGFTPGRYLDGLLLPFGARGYAQPRVETYGLERIEVLKGPSSGLYGQASPGGVINMTSKRPTEDYRNEVIVQGGSFDRFQGGFDFSGPVDADGRLLYRLTGLVRDSGTQFDYVTDDKVFIAPSFTWKASADTTINFSVQYQEIDAAGGGGAPALPAIGTLYPSSKGRISRDRYVGDPDYDRFRNEQTLVGYTLDHRFNDALSFRQTARYSEVDTDTRRVQIGAMPTDTQAIRYAWAFPESSRAIQVDNQLAWKFDTGPVKHNLLIGFDYLRESSNFTESQLTLLLPPISPPLFDLYNPDYANAGIQTPPDGMRIDQRRDQLGLYLQDQIAIDKLHLTFAGRYDWTHSRTRTWTHASNATATARNSPEHFTGRVGASWRFDNGIAPYMAYSTSFQPLSGTNRLGTPFKPSTGEQVEAGVKYMPAGSDTLVTLAVFQLDQKNVLAPDPLNTSFNTQTGAVRLRGVELEAKAQVTRGLDVTASYAYTDSEIRRTNATDSTGQQGNQMAFVPRHQAGVWVDYTFQAGALRGLGMGAGATYRGSSYGDNANNYAIPAVTLVDMALRYELGNLSEALRGAQVALNISNVFDKEYVATCLGPLSCYWGAERTVLATLRYRW